MGFITQWMDQYGYFTLFIALLLEMLALPLPGELLMSYAGLQVFQGHLNWLLSILTAGIGTSAGMTCSYWIGRHLGYPFFEKYGKRIHMGPEKLDKVSAWFSKYGNKMLIIAYFIPGVRHITGYFSGVTRIPFRTYMKYAYTGAFIWVATFISLGKILGPKWEKFHHTMTRYLIIGGLIGLIIVLMIYAYRKYRQRIISIITKMLEQGAATFRSLLKLRLLVMGASVVFLVFFISIVALIQNFLANESGEFDLFVSYLVAAVFDESWIGWMRVFNFLSSLWVLLPLFIFSVLWVLLRSRERHIEAGFAVFILAGGEIWEEGLQRLFQRGSTGSDVFTFPSEQTFMTIIFLGFAAYLFVRHRTAAWLRIFSTLVVVSVSLLVGVSRIYLNIQYPSDVLAGYIFGGFWLSFNIMLLEIFRYLGSNKSSLFH
jgi:membrane protein DedA with SNARE-associated domain/membrane-associated phospholipid phosphatase